MKRKHEDKAVKPQKDKAVKNEQTFFYPENQITVRAESKEDADKEYKIMCKKL